MALHPDFPESPYAILDPSIRWFPADETLRETSSDKLTDGRLVVVETKGQEDLDVPPKMEWLRQWCEDINRIQADASYDFVFVDEEIFDRYDPKLFKDLLNGFKEYKDES